ncbi:MAG: MFS transporter [Sphingomicrobium sp.]
MSVTAAAAAPPSLGAMTERQKSLAFFTLIVALVLEIVDLTIVNTALPVIQRDFGGNAAYAQWIVAGYSLSFAMLLVLGGRLGDLYGCRAMFLIGVSGFTIASIACGAAHGPQQLVAARILQGAAGAIMAPQVLAMMQLLYTPVERISRLAWFGVIGGLAAIAGPIIGGALIAADLFGLGWRTIFLINGPVGLGAVVAATLYLPRAGQSARSRIDLIGTVTFGLALATMLIPLIRGERLAWHWASIVSFAAAVVLTYFGWKALKRRKAAGKPIIFDPALMSIPIFRQALIIAVCFSAANTGFLFIFAYGLQRQLGFSSLKTGLIHLPFGAGVMFGIAFIGRRFLARGGKLILTLGATIMAIASTLAISWIVIGGPGLGLLLPMLVVAGIGMGMMSGPIPPITVARIDRADAGAASGILKTVQQSGAAIGVALAGTAYFASLNHGLIAAVAIIDLILIACIFLAMALPDDIFSTKAQAGGGPISHGQSAP